MNKQQLQEKVKKAYSGLVKRNNTRQILPGLFQCCGNGNLAADIGREIGYSEHEIEKVPQDANLGLGCGNPTALASIRKGETVLDLGSGAGFDCFLAARQTGAQGKVIGVDFSPAMVEQARKNARKGHYNNVEFIVGEIENLPLDDSSVDVIISNCVINLSVEKRKVFNEAYRVLKDNGRIMISDIVLLKELPGYLMNSVMGHIACLSGAITRENYLKELTIAGFTDIQIEKQIAFPIELMLNDPIAQKIIKENDLTHDDVKEVSGSIMSLSISARK